MIQLFLIVLIFLFNSCAPKDSTTGAPPVYPPIVVDPILAPYMASFETNIGVSSAGIGAQFSDTSLQANPLGETVAECTVWSNGARIILVDPTYWANFSEDSKVEVMYHELGHCAMNMQHITGVQSDGCPISIMYPYVFGNSTCYSNNINYYFTELGSHR